MHVTRRTKRRVLPPMVRNELRARAGNQCERCGCSGPFAAHHVTPVSEGGTNELENLMLLCWPCHKAVHRERGDWYAVLMAESPESTRRHWRMSVRRSVVQITEHDFKTYFTTPWPKTVTTIDRERFTTLAQSLAISYQECGDARAYDMAAIGRVLGLKPTSAQRFASRMIAAGVMIHFQLIGCGACISQYYLNPLYYFTGKRLSLGLYLKFRKQLDRVLPKSVIAEFKKEQRRQGCMW